MYNPIPSDPYVYPGTSILINKFDIRDDAQLKVIHRAIAVLLSCHPRAGMTD